MSGQRYCGALQPRAGDQRGFLPIPSRRASSSATAKCCGGQNIRKHHLLIVDKDGNLSAQTDRSGKQGLVANKLEQAQTWQTFEFGPVVVEDGKAATLPSSFYVNCHDGYYEPRTAIGQIGPLHYIVIVVDGRREGYSTGASIPQLQQLVP